ncbi:hypothetical protein IW140_004833 [Coemansia sp. RSA 1813]|nr:hypothetical protein EV178_004879 [Coemansia sp. RSA 1646]KAJ1765766.1 hypothetical protein LPJ74_006212 [Coemansia sp. RSA 1843]KAJ2087466.1 hypothetical protein IW138_004926 [Coemansia sp. RSA 986]KAJ2211716.1 hypothetical protein EV179_005273 [Coemansia sp. RSA 487]KAJ2566645.1 hypothetical protein IW140_004833 [Coemansia sp. RSA 1813]
MAFRATAVMRHGFKLRPSFEIALRSSCLQLVLARWGLETAALMGVKGEQTANDDDRKVRAVEAITRAMYESGLDDHATSAEKTMLEKPYQSWEYEDYAYGDHWEAFGVLQWLLGRQHKIPPYYSNFDRARLFQGTGIMPAEPSTVEKFVDPFMSPQTHQSLDMKQLQHEIDVAEAWLWRARAQVLLGLRNDLEMAKQQKSTTGTDEESPAETALRTKHIPHSLRKMARDIPKTIPLAAAQARDKGLVGALEGNDFAIVVELKDKDASTTTTTTVPYVNLDSNHQDAIRKIAESRFFAFAWAVGKADKWNADAVSELVSINPISSVWTA